MIRVETVTGDVKVQRDTVDVVVQSPAMSVQVVREGPQGPVTQWVAGEVITGAPGSAADFDVVQDGATATLSLTVPQGTAGPAIGGILTTKGDMVARDAATAVRVPVGTAGQVLTADPTAAAGVRWTGMVRTSRPNIDDRLVETWDGSKWIVTHYNSGIRDITGMLVNGWTATWVRIVRIDQQISLMAANLSGANATSHIVIDTMPTGFLPYVYLWMLAATNSAKQALSMRIGANISCLSGEQTLWTAVSLDTTRYTRDGIPMSLPGTNHTPAP